MRKFYHSAFLFPSEDVCSGRQKRSTYLRSFGLSVGKKLCFFLRAYMGLSFCAIIDLSCNCFLYCYARDVGFSHIYTESWKQHLSCSVKTLFWGGVGGVVPYINGYYFNTCYSTSFPFFFLFWVLTCSGLSHSPNRLSSYVLFFLVNKRLQAEKAFNYKQPQMLGWWLLTHARKPIAYFTKYQKKTKSHCQSLLADELLILWIKG